MLKTQVKTSDSGSVLKLFMIGTESSIKSDFHFLPSSFDFFCYTYLSNEARSHLCNERYIRVELTPSPLLCNAIWAYMRPFEPGISPKCTIFNDKVINTHGSTCSRNNQIYQEMNTFIDIMPFWSIYGRFWPKKCRSNQEKKRFAQKLHENVIEIGRGGGPVTYHNMALNGVNT